MATLASSRTIKNALYQQLARIGKSVSSPQRLAILDRLANGECVSCLLSPDSHGHQQHTSYGCASQNPSRTARSIKLNYFHDLGSEILLLRVWGVNPHPRLRIRSRG